MSGPFGATRMQAIAAQIHDLASEADDGGRYEILKALGELQRQLESPKDTFMRLYNLHLQLAVIYVGIETNIFQELAEGGSQALTAAEVVKASGAAPELLERLLRYLASMGYITNPTPNHYGANKLTHVLASPVARAGVTHAFDTCGPAIQAFPSFLAEHKYQEISSNTETPFQKGHNTNLSAFAWLQGEPKLFNALQQVMTAVQSNEWLEGLDVLDQSVGSAAPPSGPESEVPFFVDIGGGHGHQCIQLLQKHPRLENRIVLQDLPEAIDRIPIPLPQGIRAIPHDFFTPQPAATRGATFFYLRRILHDWPDEDCLRILKHVRDAMSSAPGKSKILIDEVVLPDVNAPWQAVMQDVSMGILFGGKERTRTQWEGLVAKAGLKISEVKIYSVGSCAGVVVLDKA